MCETDVTKLDQGYLPTFSNRDQFKLDLRDYEMVFVNITLNCF